MRYSLSNCPVYIKPTNVRFSSNPSYYDTTIECTGCSKNFPAKFNSRKQAVPKVDYYVHCVEKCPKFAKLGLISKCPKCPAIFLNRDGLKTHFLQVHTSSSWKSVEQIKIDKSQVRTRLKDHNLETLTNSWQMSTRRSYIPKNAVIHSEFFDFDAFVDCVGCSKRFPAKSDYKNFNIPRVDYYVHCVEQCPKIKKLGKIFKCPKCPLIFLSRGAFVNHARRTHKMSSKITSGKIKPSELLPKLSISASSCPKYIPTHSVRFSTESSYYDKTMKCFGCSKEFPARSTPKGETYPRVDYYVHCVEQCPKFEKLKLTFQCTRCPLIFLNRRGFSLHANKNHKTSSKKTRSRTKSSELDEDSDALVVEPRTQAASNSKISESKLKTKTKTRGSEVRSCVNKLRTLKKSKCTKTGSKKPIPKSALNSIREYIPKNIVRLFTDKSKYDTTIKCLGCSKNFPALSRGSFKVPYVEYYVHCVEQCSKFAKLNLLTKCSECPLIFLSPHAFACHVRWTNHSLESSSKPKANKNILLKKAARRSHRNLSTSSEDCDELSHQPDSDDQQDDECSPDDDTSSVQTETYERSDRKGSELDSEREELEPSTAELAQPTRSKALRETKQKRRRDSSNLSASDADFERRSSSSQNTNSGRYFSCQNSESYGSMLEDEPSDTNSVQTEQYDGSDDGSEADPAPTQSQPQTDKIMESSRPTSSKVLSEPDQERHRDSSSSSDSIQSSESDNSIIEDEPYQIKNRPRTTCERVPTSSSEESRESVTIEPERTHCPSVPVCEPEIQPGSSNMRTSSESRNSSLTTRRQRNLSSCSEDSFELHHQNNSDSISIITLSSESHVL